MIEYTPEEVEFCKHLEQLLRLRFELTRTFNAEEPSKLIGPFDDALIVPLTILKDVGKPFICFDFNSIEHFYYSEKKKLLKDANIIYFVIDVKNPPSDKQIEELINSSNLKASIFKKQKNGVNVTFKNEIPETQIPIEKQSLNSKIVFIGVIGIVIFQSFGFILNKFKENQEQGHVEFEMVNENLNDQIVGATAQASSAPTVETVAEKRRSELLKTQCDNAVPPNGVLSINKQFISPKADAWWILSNDSDGFAYFWISNLGINIAEVIVAPKSSYTMKSPALTFNYKVIILEKWCNKYQANNAGLLPSKTSINQLTKEFQPETIANTKVYLHTGYSQTYTSYEKQ